MRQSVAGRSTGSIVAGDRGKTSDHARKESGYFSPDSRSRTPENVLETRWWHALGVEYWMDNWTVSDVTGHAGIIGQYLANAIISDKSK